MPPDGQDEDVAYEFFAPFAHVEGVIEWCRIRSPTHGVFDTCILIDRDPVVVYVSSDEGARFMAERYLECETYRVAPNDLVVAEAEGGRMVRGWLEAEVGPLRHARMVLHARPDARPRQRSYGGAGAPVWGSKRWTCWGVDLVLDGQATGVMVAADGAQQRFRMAPCLVTLGSFGRIAPQP